MRRSLVALALAVTLPLPVLAGQVTVREGETLSEIAERHGISLNQLMQINGIRDADLVEAGATLKLPGGSGGRSATAGRTSAGTVVVRDGETLSEIAERHGIGLSRLMQINGIRDADLVEAGQTLRLQAPPSTARTASGPAPSTPSYPRGAKEHVVRSGESLSLIASGYGISLSKLIAINGIGDPDRVEAGTRLKLKGNAAAPAPRPPVTTAAVNAGAARPPVRPQTTKPATVALARPVATAAPADTAAAKPAATTPVAQPATKAAAQPAATTPAARPVAAAAITPAARPAAAAAAATTAARPAAAASSTVAMARPDWRTYGSLQVNWAAWQPMGGSMVAPTLNRQGQTLYVAVNCGARKFNTTTPSGEWLSWNDPSGDDERQLVNDYCRNRS